jgi:hypothetical protein
MAAAVHVLMKRSLINDPAYWRERAEEARRIAEQLADAVAKQTMLEIARSYDNLAELTEKHPAFERSDAAAGQRSDGPRGRDGSA